MTNGNGGAEEALRHAVESVHAMHAQYGAMEAVAVQAAQQLADLKAKIQQAHTDTDALNVAFSNGSGVPEALDTAQASIGAAQASQIVSQSLIASFNNESAVLTAAAQEAVNNIQTFRNEYET